MAKQAKIADAPIEQDATFDYVKDGASVDKLITDVIVSASGLLDRVHVALVSAGLHLIEHGDTTKLQRLVNGSGLGYHRTAMLRWAVAFLPINWRVDKDDNDVAFAKVTIDKARRPEFELMLADNWKDLALKVGEVPFHKFAAPVLFKGFDFKARWAALIKEGEAYEDGTAKAMQSETFDQDKDGSKIKLAGLAQAKLAYAQA